MTRATYKAIRRYCRCSRATLKFIEKNPLRHLKTKAYGELLHAEHEAWLRLPLHLRSTMHDPLEP
jgi:hypothetical protein